MDPKQHPNGWYWPVEHDTRGVYLSWLAFCPRREAWHLGQDFLSSSGRPVFALSRGVILSSSERVRGYGKGGDPGGAAILLIKTSSGEEFKVLYGHIQNVPPKGTEVEPGQIFCEVNNYFLPHIHFAVHPGRELPENPWQGYTDQEGETWGWIDPLAFLAVNKPA